MMDETQPAGPARSRLQIRALPGGRLHLHDGPIDLVLAANGAPGAVRRAWDAATARAATLLDELCTELPLLRSPAGPGMPLARGAVARRMQAAVAPHAAGFITPMAAVAGAVAEAVLEAMIAAAPLETAYVNNGGDIALHLAPGQRLTVGMVDRPDRPSLFGQALIGAEDEVRGLATSGWRGRSHSLGIADAVTVLAAAAPEADAAATVIANAVDLPGHPAISRVPCAEIDPDSDLGSRPVTRAVGRLTPEEVTLALSRGRTVARDLLAAGLIRAAALHLAGQTVVEGRLALGDASRPNGTSNQARKPG